MMRFISFGSGSSGNCCCLFTEHDGLMIDIGVGCRQLKKQFNEYGLSLSKVKRILLTHDHSDHIMAVGSMSHNLNIPVYTTKEVHAGVERNYRVIKKIDGANVKYLVKGQPVILGDFEVTPFEVPHDSSDNVGYMVSHDGVNFCLITDAGCVNDNMKPFIQKAHYLVIEADYDDDMLNNGHYPAFLKERIQNPNGHLSNHECAMALVENASQALRHVWLCHLSSNNNRPDVAIETVTSVLKEHGFVVGKDFLLDPLKRREPTGIYDLK